MGKKENIFSRFQIGIFISLFTIRWTHLKLIGPWYFFYLSDENFFVDQIEA